MAVSTVRLATCLVGGKVRSAEYLGRPHIVVPVVALVEGVIHPVNASTPELVTAEEISKSVQGWNGRPIVMGHPADNAARISANDPRVMERYAFGTIFNARLEDGKLKMDAWLDPEAAGRAGNDALQVMKRIEKGETVDVSVGAFVDAQPMKGTYAASGKTYDAVWRDIVPDHLAMLPAGTPGACDTKMGCGAPRSAQHNDKDKDDQELPHDATPSAARPIGGKTMSGIVSKIADLFKAAQDARARAAQEMSDGDIRLSLDKALLATEPGYLYVENVYPAKNGGKVVYSCAPDGSNHSYRRSYSMSGTDVSLAEDREEVKSILTYEVVPDKDDTDGEDDDSTVTAAQQSANSGDCGCAEGGKKMAQAHRNAARIKALVKDHGDVLTRKFLESLSDPQLKALEARLTAAEDDDEEEDDEEMPAFIKEKMKSRAKKKAQDEEEEMMKEDEEEEKMKAKAKKKAQQSADASEDASADAAIVAGLPQHLQDIISGHRAAEAKKKETLVSELKAAQSTYSEQDLSAMDVASLEKMAKAFVQLAPKSSLAGKVADFSGQFGPRTAQSSDEVPDPPKLSEKIRAAQQVH